MVRGDGPSPALVLRLAQALPDDSLTHALMLGGREHYGWGHDRHLLASVFDAIQQNTIATGQWKKGKQPSFKGWPRPEGKKNKPKKTKKSVADLFAAMPKPKDNPYG